VSGHRWGPRYGWLDEFTPPVARRDETGRPVRDCAGCGRPDSARWEGEKWVCKNLACGAEFEPTGEHGLVDPYPWVDELYDADFDR
jgi:ribosomal protein L37AE/L43A